MASEIKEKDLANSYFSKARVIFSENGITAKVQEIDDYIATLNKKKDSEEEEEKQEMNIQIKENDNGEEEIEITASEININKELVGEEKQNEEDKMNNSKDD